MAKLPSNTFMFNYNARFYDPATYTFAKTKGQLFDEDLVLNKAPTSYGEDNVNFGNSGAYMGKSFSDANSNPFNRSSSLGNSFTFIYKTSDWYNGTDNTNIFANRDNNYNWMIRKGSFHTSSNILSYSVTSNPQIVFIRVQSNGNCKRTVINKEGTVLQTATDSTTPWGNTSNGVAFFAGYRNGTELFNRIFYWMYCSMEALTDEEILKVIKYNENPVSFSIDPESEMIGVNGGSFTVDVESENPWTASTTDNWLTLSQTTGSTDATISVSAPYNQFDTRIGTIEFTDGVDTLTLTVSQNSANTLIPTNKIFRNGNRIN